MPDLDLEFGREASERRLWAISSHCGSYKQGIVTFRCSPPHIMGLDSSTEVSVRFNSFYGHSPSNASGLSDTIRRNFRGAEPTLMSQITVLQ
jgi:hypothetical protein